MLSFSGSQSLICSMPIRYDSYRGCSHGCSYCFASHVNKKEGANGSSFYSSVQGEDISDLARFLKNQTRKDNGEYIKGSPIHWGGMSDGFQPAELKMGVSYRTLELFAVSKYPVVISTKGLTIISRPEYVALLRKCNVVVQASIISGAPEYYDKGAPPFYKRIDGIKALVDAGIKVVVRIQPYMMHNQASILDMLDQLLDCEGVILEGLKDKKKFCASAVRVGVEYVYPLYDLAKNFMEIREKCSALGLRFYVGENRLRWLGDAVNCCGVADIPGFGITNAANVTQLFFHKNISFSNMCDKRFKGFTPQSGTQETLLYKVHANVDQKFGDKAIVEFAKHYVNHGLFAQDHELTAVGKDATGNYVFKFSDSRVESIRLQVIKERNRVVK